MLGAHALLSYARRSHFTQLRLSRLVHAAGSGQRSDSLRARPRGLAALGGLVGTIGGAALWWLAPRADEGVERARADAQYEAYLARLPSVEQAQRTRAVRVPRFLSDAEIERFEAQLEDELLPLPLGTLGRDAYGVPQLCDAPWETVYLHTDHSFQRVCPSLATKLVELAHRVDAAEGWGLLSAPATTTTEGASDGPAPARLRVVELHSVTAGGGLGDPMHFDGGSLVTCDVMLARPGVDFTGGQLCTPEADGTSTAHTFERGDAIVFVSHKRHFVAPVTSGCRRVLVAELWGGGERSCAHRCLDPRGECSYTTMAARAERFLRAEAPEGW